MYLTIVLSRWRLIFRYQKCVCSLTGLTRFGSYLKSTKLSLPMCRMVLTMHRERRVLRDLRINTRMLRVGPFSVKQLGSILNLSPGNSLVMKKKPKQVVMEEGINQNKKLKMLVMIRNSQSLTKKAQAPKSVSFKKRRKLLYKVKRDLLMRFIPSMLKVTNM
jgi:hypothetical protein